MALVVTHWVHLGAAAQVTLPQFQCCPQAVLAGKWKSVKQSIVPCGVAVPCSGPLMSAPGRC